MVASPLARIYRSVKKETFLETQEKTLYEYLDTQESKAVALLGSLVNIDTGSYDKSGIDQAILLLKKQMDDLNMETRVIELAERGNHLLAKKPGKSDHNVLLIGHCDTVFPIGTVAERPFRIEDGRAYGPGVADMKGGLVVLITALAAIKAVRHEVWDDLGISVIFNSDEEIGSTTSRAYIESEASQARAVCVLEPARPGGEYVTQRKGHGTYILRITGKSAHAGSQPELGASAIHELLRMGLEIQAHNDFTSGLTVNIGVIRGGIRPNVVADFAEAEIDVRIPKVEDSERIENAFQEIASETRIPGTHAELSGGIDFPPMPLTEASVRLFEYVRKAGSEIGLNLNHIATGAASDGNYASRFAPTIDGMGPQGDGTHSPKEFIVVSTLVERAKVLARFLTLWGETIG
jgi:glutamate carboxypeptidase